MVAIVSIRACRNARHDDPAQSDGRRADAFSCRRHDDPGYAPQKLDQAVPDTQQGLAIGFPTAQTNLLATDDPTVFMPTASGRVESALYGSTRTGRDAIPRFHAGIDIAPMERDRQGRPRDAVYAVADGTVAYVNAAAGRSNYGRYMVLEHQDPVGPVFSLYAHLASVNPAIEPGQPVTRGDRLGIMGNSSTLNIPMQRAHLHFEFCMMMNRRFRLWCEKQGLETWHGLHHGWNLAGIDPLALYRVPDERFSMLEHVRQLPVAFELIARVERAIDYFDRYPALWQGGIVTNGVVTLAVCEGGVLTDGRGATAEESARLRARPHQVLRVEIDNLGRNGRRLIVLQGNQWALSALGERWLDIVLY